MNRLARCVGLFFIGTMASVSAADVHWIADVKTGCKIWNPYPRPNESVQWNGNCKDGLAEGKGIVQWVENGQLSSKCECEYHDGKRNGHGVDDFSEGLYDGDFRDNSRDGQGTMTWFDGSTYVGEWRHDVPNGYGVFKDAKRPVLMKGRWVDGCLRTIETEVRLFYTKGGCGQV